MEAAARDDAPDALHFAERRGFQVDRHIFESTLDLAAFDERLFVAALERARAAGYLAAVVQGLADARICGAFINQRMLKAARQYASSAGYGLHAGRKGG